MEEMDSQIYKDMKKLIYKEALFELRAVEGDTLSKEQIEEIFKELIEKADH
ncbi:MAG: hypothetical protein Q4P72_03480 [Eubacteriales bacterium]|nr:hypothetical protein [Eubacteriales bacterium]